MLLCVHGMSILYMYVCILYYMYVSMYVCMYVCIFHVIMLLLGMHYIYIYMIIHKNDGSYILENSLTFEQHASMLYIYMRIHKNRITYKYVGSHILKNSLTYEQHASLLAVIYCIAIRMCLHVGSHILT